MKKIFKFILILGIFTAIFKVVKIGKLDEEYNNKRKSDVESKDKKVRLGILEKMATREDGNEKTQSLNNRQKKLYELILSNSDSSMSNIAPHFKSVTNRTLRRDLNLLEEMQLISRSGKTKSVIYNAL